MSDMSFFFTIDNIDVENKHVLVRLDMNSPLDPETKQIIEFTKIKSYVPTIKELIKLDSKIVILTHQGRPGDNDFIETKSHAEHLSKFLGHPVTFIDGIIDSHTLTQIRNMSSGDVVLLQNVRFLAEETLERPPHVQAQTHLVRKLSPLFKAFICDAVGAMHRSQPSLVGFPEVLPTAAGRLMETELTNLSVLKARAMRPYVFILGGGKLKDAVDYIQTIINNKAADKIILVGLVANMFLAAIGYDLGRGMTYLKNKKAEALFPKIREIMAEHDDMIYLPVDFAYLSNGERSIVTIEDLPISEPLMDIGPETVSTITDIIMDAGLVVMRGPAGYAENPLFREGTREIIKAMAKSNAITVCGGGHLGIIASELGVRDKITHISTAGGAMISFFAGKPLPVVDELKSSVERYLHER